jgi:transcription-repair coupling factor (superfamily II helicase)
LDIQKLLSKYQELYGERFAQLCHNKRKIRLHGLLGSSFSVFVASDYLKNKGFQLIVLPEKESAAYIYNDLENLLNDSKTDYYRKKVMFFPSAYKRPYETDHPDNANLLSRTEVIARLNSGTKDLLLISFPEALSEKIVSKKYISSNTTIIRVGEEANQDDLIEKLGNLGFERVDFVVEPGQFALRGGLMDVFSFAYDHPYRLEFFGDDIESVRTFDPSTQLSIKQLKSAKILPNLQRNEVIEKRNSIFHLLPKKAKLWSKSQQFIIDKLNHGFKLAEKHFNELSEAHTQMKPDQLFMSGDDFISDIQAFQQIIIDAEKSQADFNFDISPQPHFNKQFDLLLKELKKNDDEKIETIIASESDKQLLRLQEIFDDIEPDIEYHHYTGVKMGLHKGFVDKDAQLALFTDHQIFDRYQRFRLREGFGGKEAITIKELSELRKGDFVTHIDHGIGKYDGLQKIVNNGKEQEVIRLIYLNNDLLFVNIHSLHRIARYSGKDGKAPKLNKIGSPTWKTLKNKTKKKVKDIAEELIKLYAQRKSKPGYAFMPDTYLQTELEASFIYEDTPDQMKATSDFKKDMEANHPMDRLICGDVGFGKTEIAIRAAFKAVADSKQVAVLVPTTILAYQHFKTFSERLKDFPVRIDYISRFRSRKQTTEVLKDLANAKIDILIGTHKIVGKDIKFNDLGLLIIDEEQKFGVTIKEKMKKLKVNVDTLTLTATPIPRTLQFSLMGARDLSIINTPPPNRQPVLTEVHSFSEEIIGDAINYEVSRRGQVFFVHNRVQNIGDVANMIHKFVPDVKIAIAHGQMDGSKLEKTMLDFIEGDYDVLIATKIIESGLDIPNVNTIIINEANHYGLSELHQMRGRVGRSNKKAFCYLLSPPKTVLTDEARKRLQAIEEFSSLGSGFNIAMRDLDIRGAGNILGAEQSGFISDIGFEMYQKILDEALIELKTTKENKKTDTEPSEYIADCKLDTDLNALLPDDYIYNISERLALYKELSSIKDIDQLSNFRKDLEDRFGSLHQAAQNLIDLVRLKWLGKSLGFEMIRIKNEQLFAYFIENQSSSFYSGSYFAALLSKIQSTPNCKLREKNGKLSLIFKNISKIDQAYSLLKSLKEELIIIED